MIGRASKLPIELRERAVRIAQLHRLDFHARSATADRMSGYGARVMVQRVPRTLSRVTRSRSNARVRGVRLV